MKKLLILLGIVTSYALPNTWINPDAASKYSYVYAPGIMSSETQLGKYCPRFVASTGQIVTCQTGVETIQPEVTPCNFCEINLKSNATSLLSVKNIVKAALAGSAYSCAKNYLSEKQSLAIGALAFSALFAKDMWQQLNFGLSYVSNKRFGFNFAAGQRPAQSSVSCHYLDLFAINVGQHNDIDAYKAKVNEHIKKYPHDKIILYGVSRGSATVFNYFALYDSPQVAAVICEGIFDSLSNITKYTGLASRLKINLLKHSGLTQFKADGICPLTSVQRKLADKPIAIITSLADKEVPYQCTLNLYKKLREKGLTKVHILILKESSHPTYPLGREKETYRNFIHAFYKQYKLPYIEAYAVAGKNIFSASQPTSSYVDKLIKLRG